MAGIALVGYTLCVVAVVTIVWLIVRRRATGGVPLAPPVQSLLDAARKRAVFAVLSSAAVVVALFVVGYFLNALVGLPIVLAPALGGATGLLLYSATPPRVVELDSDAARAASLTPRTPLSFVPTRGSSILAVVVILQIAFLIFTGATSSPDESGRYRMIAFQTADSGSASSPYAGWFYGLPLLVTTVILVATTLLALWRVSSTPALPHPDLAEVDAGWRRATARIIVAIGGAALLLQFGEVAIQSGLAIRNAYFDGVPSGWDMIGQLFEGAGLLMMIGSIVALTLAALWALTLPDLSLMARTPIASRSGDGTREGMPQ